MRRRQKKHSSKASKPQEANRETNADQGVISFVERDDVCADFTTECENCGTLIEFFTDRCPVCGKKFEIADTGLVSLFSDMSFETDRPTELDCPVCGQRIRLAKGKCPKCKEPIAFAGRDDPGVKVDPIVHDDNIVFVHLDVESGEVNCLQRVENSSGLEHLSVHVETIGQGEFDRARRGVSRM